MRIDHFTCLLAALAAIADAQLSEPPPPIISAPEPLFQHTASRFSSIHRAASRRTSQLARDLRLSYHGLRLAARSADGVKAQRVLAAGQKLYCTAPRGTSANQIAPQNPASSSGADSGQGSTSADGTRPPASASQSGGVTSSSISSSPTKSPTSTPTRTTTPTSTFSSSSKPSPTPSSPWSVWKSWSGQDFFSWNWNWDESSLTHGLVDYQSASDAQSANIAYVNDAGNFIMKVETTATVSGNRKSVRIATTDRFDGGLIVLDALHMPQGCGTWPAFWTTGSTWPGDGEIDILEGVHDSVANQAALHTAVGCTLPSSGIDMTGSIVGSTDCSTEHTGNNGCAVRSPDRVSYGAGFNGNGGGVYATQWDSSGIAIWFFPAGSTPSDLSAGAPNPGGWGQPVARFPATDCDIATFFKQHMAIFDTTLCGDWAGPAWTVVGSPGQEQSCAQRTGYSTCDDYVRNNGASFQQAYWEVRSVKIYQKS